MPIFAQTGHAIVCQDSKHFGICAGLYVNGSRKSPRSAERNDECGGAGLIEVKWRSWESRSGDGVVSSLDA